MIQNEQFQKYHALLKGWKALDLLIMMHIYAIYILHVHNVCTNVHNGYTSAYL